MTRSKWMFIVLVALTAACKPEKGDKGDRGSKARPARRESLDRQDPQARSDRLQILRTGPGCSRPRVRCSPPA